MRLRRSVTCRKAHRSQQFSNLTSSSPVHAITAMEPCIRSPKQLKLRANAMMAGASTPSSVKNESLRASFVRPFGNTLVSE